MQSAVRVWRKQQKNKAVLGKQGIILSWTDIFVSPPQYESQTPYTVILVELENKEKVYGQFTDFTEKTKAIGQRVMAVLRRNGDVGPEDIVEYDVKFKPMV